MAITNDILSTTLRALSEKYADSLARSLPILDSVEVTKLDGGSKLDVALMLSQHSNLTQLTTGTEPLDMSYGDTFRNGSSEWCDFSAPVIITGKERKSNLGDRQIISLVDSRTKNVYGMLQREVEKQLVAGNSTLTDLNTLNGAVAGGFLHAAAFGSQTGTVQGIAKGSFPTSYQNQYVDAGGTLTLDHLSNLMVDIQVHTGRCDLIIASVAGFKTFRGLLQDNERYMSADALRGAGSMSLMYAGAEVRPTAYLTGVVDSAGDPLSFIALDRSKFQIYSVEGSWFSTSDFVDMTPGAQDALTARIDCRVQLVAEALCTHGIIGNGNA